MNNRTKRLLFLLEGGSGNSKENLLHITVSSTTLTDSDGNVMTINVDGESVTVNGTQNKVTTFLLTTSFSAPAGDYVLSMTPTDGSSSSYRCQIMTGTTNSSSVFAFTDGADKLFTLENDNPHAVRLRLGANYVCDNLVFTFSVRKATVADRTAAARLSLSSPALLFGSENEPDIMDVAADRQQWEGVSEDADDQSGYSSDENDIRDDSENTDDLRCDTQVRQ
jgi:hypothetical protein